MLSFVSLVVHCRVGSLETPAPIKRVTPGVHCGVGSLESNIWQAAQQCHVHCRVGGLETLSPTERKHITHYRRPRRNSIADQGLDLGSEVAG